MNLWNVDWLNSNSQRKYPLADASDGVDSSGAFRLPDDFIVDMTMVIPSALVVQPGGFHLLSIAVFAGGAVLTFGYEGSPLAVVSVPSATHTRNASYALVGQGSGFDIAGSVTIGVFDTLNHQPAGVFTFTLEHGRLAAAAVRPSMRGVSGLLVGNAATDALITGDVILVAGRNFKITRSGQELRLDCLAESSALEESCGCENPALLRPPIRSINNVFPDAEGRISITGDDCIVFSSEGSTVKVNDLCSKPCCGCKELEIIMTDISFLYQQIGEAIFQLTRVEGSLENMESNVLAAKLGTRPTCPTA